MPWTLTTTGLQGTQQRYALAAQTTSATIARVMTTRLSEAATYARATFRSAAATTPTATAVRTGALRAALDSTVQVTGQTITGVFGYLRGPAPYAGVHERIDGAAGTTIRPVHRQFLTIPLDAAKTAAGVPRGTARDFPNTFIARSRRSGQLIIFQRQGKNIVPLFLLLKEVFVPARPALLPTLQKFVPLIVSDLQAEVTKTL